MNPLKYNLNSNQNENLVKLLKELNNQDCELTSKLENELDPKIMIKAKQILQKSSWQKPQTDVITNMLGLLSLEDQIQFGGMNRVAREDRIEMNRRVNRDRHPKIQYEIDSVFNFLAIFLTTKLVEIQDAEGYPVELNAVVTAIAKLEVIKKNIRF